MGELAGQWMVLVAGPVRSGKSTLAGRIAERFGGMRVGFGDAVRQRTLELGLPAGRTSWQQVGAQWVAEDPEGMCDAVLANAAGQAVVVVDGVRHQHIYELLRTRAGSRRVVLVYVDADIGVRRQRLALDGLGAADIAQILGHSTEAELPGLRDAADMVADGTNGTHQVLADIGARIAGGRA